MFEKHLWKSAILSKNAGRWPASYDLHLRQKIREILIKNQNEKSREIFRDIHWLGHHTKIPTDNWCEPSTL